MTRRTVAERLAHRSAPEGDCLVWTGARKVTGYGELGIGRRVVYAHRAAYEVAYGPIPPGLQIRHICHNPPCIRAEHLRVGTAQDNADDRVERVASVIRRFFSNGAA